MRYVSRKEFAPSKKHGYTGIYSDYDGLHPDWKGKRTIMTGDDGPGTKLFIEGVSFEIVEDDDERCPKQFLIVFFSGKEKQDAEIGRNVKWFKTEQEAIEWAKANRPYESAGFKVWPLPV